MTNLDEIKKQFSSLNDMQQKAVFQTEGPVLILAGAGSGKTTVLVNRIAYIIKAGLAEPWQILAITFTNKAAGELKERIEAVCGEGSDEVWAATFHSTCARILRRWGDRLGFSSHFTIYDTDDSRRLMKEILKQLDIDEKFLPHKAVLNEISKYKDKMKEPKDIQTAASYDSRLKYIAQAYELYQQRLLTSDAMDFDDLICNTIKLFEQNQDVLEFYQRRFKYIMVDEYQDTNKSQYRLISLLSQARNNLCVVGDDDQSIYRFRGATIENILSFENEFKGAVVIRLEQNYRSTGTILDAANNVIKNNDERKGKTLWTENPKGERITVHTAASEREEALFIAQTIFDGVAKGRNYSDYAILYRMNAQSNAIEQALSRSGIPHRVIGGHRFYDREEIKDMTSYLQVVNNPHDDIRLRRIINKPKRAIGEATMTKVAEIAAGIGESVYSVIRHASDYPTLARAAAKLESFAKLIEGFVEAAESGDYSIAELYNLILEHTDYKNYLIAEKDDYEQRIENIDELSSNIIKFQEDYGDDASLGAFLEEISLMTDIDNYDADADCTVMMTLHSAKGLEFPVVFIPGMEDGVFPSMATIMEAGELNEERRLAYVGITRAKEKLYLIKTRERMLFGSTTHNRESRFVTEIPSSLIDRTGSENIFASGRQTERRPMQQNNFDPFAKRKPSAPKTAPTTNVYHIGDVVLHNAFGKGMIISTTAMGNDTLLEIAFDSVGTKKVMANFAKMEIIK
ncbi:MAG: UvrD-helicase domain-containing protein [Ruminococcus sp.]|uniref:ATP-dependent helicase n=1 Tax=Ruminococcus sp. TaxID=41978 RepID=UPI0028734044|nr:UvrD-helicase domain-containing protein [Ruminococcus sp.]MBQ3284092.1 UvrD-helicase domain-containing protein [Ruminococcus sp.]